MVKSFRDLDVWRKAHGLALDVYRLTEKFPDRERFGVVAQLRRAAVSVPANIAEGFGRRTTKELLNFLAISSGSLEETRYLLLLSADLGYIAGPDFPRLNGVCDSVAQMLNALGRSLRSRAAARQGTDHESRATSHGQRPGGVRQSN